MIGGNGKAFVMSAIDDLLKECEKQKGNLHQQLKLLESGYRITEGRADKTGEWIAVLKACISEFDSLLTRYSSER